MYGQIETAIVNMHGIVLHHLNNHPTLNMRKNKWPSPTFITWSLLFFLTTSSLNCVAPLTGKKNSYNMSTHVLTLQITAVMHDFTVWS